MAGDSSAGSLFAKDRFFGQQDGDPILDPVETPTIERDQRRLHARGERSLGGASAALLDRSVQTIELAGFGQPQALPRDRTEEDFEQSRIHLGETGRGLRTYNSGFHAEADRVEEQARRGVRVGVLMGSRSDWAVMREAAQILEQLGIAHEVRVVSAHRTPDLLYEYAANAAARGLRAIIAGAGGAAHLPGMLAAKTLVPVLGVPVPSQALNGIDSLLSIVQMPAGVPVATFAIGVAGARNAALFAAAILAREDAALAEALAAFRARQTAEVLAHSDPREE